MDLRVVAYVLGRLAEACGAALLLPFSDGLAKIAERLTGAGREKVRL